MFSTEHCFEKYNTNDRSPFSFKRCDGPILPLYACTRANHARYSSVHVTICGSSKHSFKKKYSGKNLTGRKCRAYRTISYKICGNITLFKTTWTESVGRLVIFAVIICITGQRFRALFHLYLFFLTTNFFFFF